MLILVAAVSIGIAAVQRLITPKPLEQIGIGLGVSVAASFVNLGVALVLRRAAKQYKSITLTANAQHLMTDVWTSAGVLLGVGAVSLTGWVRLDPIVALLVAANIVWSGFHIIRKSVLGLMDTALSVEEQEALQKVLEQHLQDGIQYHALRTRQSGARCFVSLHVLVPGEWTVQRGHQLLEHIEADIRSALPSAEVFTHLESLNDPASWDDMTVEHAADPDIS
jgi:cation diffusion facilitator family transporter